MQLIRVHRGADHQLAPTAGAAAAVAECACCRDAGTRGECSTQRLPAGLTSAASMHAGRVLQAPHHAHGNEMICCTGKGAGQLCRLPKDQITHVGKRSTHCLTLSAVVRGGFFLPGFMPLRAQRANCFLLLFPNLICISCIMSYI